MSSKILILPGSLSARRAWIEMAVLQLIPLSDPSLSARRAWIEICGGACARRLALSSLSARRAWIEIKYVVKDSDFAGVALRKESVDRNGCFAAYPPVGSVALRKESVDRNLWWGVRKAVGSLSLSARRAWIEMLAPRLADMSAAWVALRKESVDRNRYCCDDVAD